MDLILSFLERAEDVHFENKKDVTIIVKFLHRALSFRQVVP